MPAGLGVSTSVFCWVVFFREKIKRKILLKKAVKQYICLLVTILVVLNFYVFKCHDICRF